MICCDDGDQSLPETLIDMLCHELQIYEGKVDPWVMSDNCTDNVPILIKRATFCSAFAADARDFRQYNSWVRHNNSSHSFMRDSSAVPDSQGCTTCMVLPAM